MAGINRIQITAVNLYSREMTVILILTGVMKLFRIKLNSEKVNRCALPGTVRLRFLKAAITHSVSELTAE